MEVTVKDFKCPACGHTIGQEEYEHVCQKFTELIETTAERRVESIRREYVSELRKRDSKHQEDMQKLRQEYETKVNEQVQSRLNEERRAARLQGQKDSEEQHRQQSALKELESRRKETIYQEKISRLQNIIESIPPQLRGDSGEKDLYTDLHNSFPDDLFTVKKVGHRMPDIVQTIVTEDGGRLVTPVLWDTKTGEKITPEDIEKAKKYKEIYNTDYCTIVTKKYLPDKYLKKGSSGLIGITDGILLVHELVAVGVAELIRNRIIEKTRLEKNNKGRLSKETRLYNYIISSARFRMMQKKIENKSKLEGLIRKREDYNKKASIEEMKIINESFELDKEDLKAISDITQLDEGSEKGKEDTDTEGK